MRVPSGSLAEMTRKPIFFLTAPLRKPRTECACQSVAFCSCGSVAPPGRLRRARILAVLDPLRGALDGLAGLAWLFRRLPEGLLARRFEGREGLGSVTACVAADLFEGIMVVLLLWAARVPPDRTLIPRSSLKCNGIVPRFEDVGEETGMRAGHVARPAREGGQCCSHGRRIGGGRLHFAVGTRWWRVRPNIGSEEWRSGARRLHFSASLGSAF